MRPSTRPISRETNTYSSSKSATAAARAGRPLGQAATTSGAPPSAISSSLTTRESSSRSSSLPPLGSDGDVLRTVPVNNLGVLPSGRALGRVKSAANLRGEVDWVFRSVSFRLNPHQTTVGYEGLGRGRRGEEASCVGGGASSSAPRRATQNWAAPTTPSESTRSPADERHCSLNR
jgi:hypothetical protein